MLCIIDFIQISIILVKFEKGSQAYVLDTFYQNERKVFLDEKCMENVQDIRKNICIRVAVEIYTRFLTLFAICIPKRRITNCT